MKAPMNKPRGYWTKERCLEDALKYKYKGDWRDVSPSAYNKAFAKKWLTECTSHMDKIKIRVTLDVCKKEAHKYQSRIEWKTNSSSTYVKACSAGWLEECCEHMPDKRWTKERCIEDALKYKSRNEWRLNGGGGAISAAYKKGWIDECCEHMVVEKNRTGIGLRKCVLKLLLNTKHALNGA